MQTQISLNTAKNGHFHTKRTNRGVGDDWLTGFKAPAINKTLLVHTLPRVNQSLIEKNILEHGFQLSMTRISE